MHHQDVQRIAAFSVDGAGGNPAGVMLLTKAATQAAMQGIAAEVGYSETAFAHPLHKLSNSWRVRYFSPESEVPFCGHATIALGHALAQRHGEGQYKLSLNEADISVTAQRSPQGVLVTLLSPPTTSRATTAPELRDALALFRLASTDLDNRLAPAHIHAGANHLVLPLHDRATLRAMAYNLDAGRDMMRRYGLVTIMLVYIQSNTVFHARNAFASGGVMEDPATGAAAAAFAGYLRDASWPHGGQFMIHQGDDMGSPSLIHIRLTDEAGAAVGISGQARGIS